MEMVIMSLIFSHLRAEFCRPPAEWTPEPGRWYLSWSPTMDGQPQRLLLPDFKHHYIAGDCQTHRSYEVGYLRLAHDHHYYLQC